MDKMEYCVMRALTDSIKELNETLKEMKIPGAIGRPVDKEGLLWLKSEVEKYPDSEHKTEMLEKIDKYLKGADS